MTNFIQVAIQKVKQKASELGKILQTPVTNPNLIKVGQTIENINRTPLIQAGQGFVSGGASGNTFGFVQTPRPTTTLGKVAYGAGQAVGMFNPQGLGSKALGALGNIGGTATKGLIGQVAPRATGLIASKILPAVGSEIAQTAGFGLASKATGQQFNPVASLALGLGTRGAFGAAPALTKGFFGRAKEVDLNLKEVDVLRDAWNRANAEGRKKLLPDVLNAADRNLPKEVIDKYIRQPGKLLIEMQKNLTSKRPQLYNTVLGFAEGSPTQPKGVGEGISSRTESYKGPTEGGVQTGKKLLTKQLPSEITTPTKATQEVSSEPIIRQKGQLNLQRLKVEEPAMQQLKDIESKVKPTVIGNKEVISASRTAKGTGTLTDAQQKNLLAQQLKNRQKVVDLSARFNKAKQEGATEVELGKIMLDMANESKTARQGGTFAGRLLQAQNIIADESAAPTQKILALLDNAGVSPEKYLKDAVKVNWDNPSEVVNFYRKFVPPKFGEILDEVRYSNMLSSPLTHIINTASNALQTGVVAPVEKTITGVLDWGKSTLTGSDRKYYARAGVDYAGGYVKSLPQAFKKALSVFSGEQVLVKPDYNRIPTGTKGVLKAYSAPLRALEAMDQFFKTLVEGGVTAELKRGPLKLGAGEISSMASKEANYRLFRQAFDPNGEMGQGTVLQFFDKWNSAIANVRRLPGGKWVLPFLQTPTNILKQGIEYSPLGATTMIGAKAPIEQLSKTIIGTGVFLGAYQLAKNGLTSWESPSSESERELYYAAGMQPYSVKIGNNWVSYSKLGPLSYPIAMAAAMADAEKKNPDKSTVANIGRGMSGILGFFGDQSYVRSIGDLVDAIQGGVNIGPTALSAEGANLAGQLVPYKSFLTWLGRTLDPVYRKASSFGERMVKDLPIIGSNLKPYTDIYGNPSKRDYPLLNAVSPYKVTQEKTKEAEMYGRYEVGKTSRAVEKRADEDFLAGNQKAQSFGGIYRYVDSAGALKKIDTSKVTSLPETNSYEKLKKEKAAYALTDDILNLPVEEQAKAFSALGISADDATYYQVAKATTDLKEAYINDAIGGIDTKDRGNLINYLVSQRKVVNGDMVLADSVVTKLYDAEIISKAEETMLKNLKIVNGKPITKLSGRGKKTTLKKVSALPAPAKIKAPNMKSLLAKTTKFKAKRYKFRRTL